MDYSCLPKPCKNLQGWPWTEDSAKFYIGNDENTNWPKISVITPSFNQDSFLEETVRSVLLQNYPNLEYIILDGGSSDSSVEIIKKYDDFIDYWVSKPDKGQADAIYKGIKMATGDIVAYINSDDFYYPGTFFKVAEKFLEDPLSGWLTGKTVFVDEFSVPMNDQPKYLPINMFTMTYLGNFITQPSTFWKKDLFLSVGGFNKNLRFCFDYELFMKFLKIEKPLWCNGNFAAFRYHSLSKTANIHDVCIEESEVIIDGYVNSDNLLRQYVGKMLGRLYSLFFDIHHK
ncbi:glycosyltransferase involved in cell wall biosynthesis [Methanomicrobium sp. W14]|uniref:glycosyltransferase family 2 protein n=1 Tax=Methanomicrobium sp. W14 TaxID=2817839 RepID=UPI001AE890C2|nr:glycosyltransferase family 2 protein [Methanomicrobium sp. W14]MBP2134575.1 glycosyltransferase involved in cell wall biosynthesis [Methanomicrobium sp. W14]